MACVSGRRARPGTRKNKSSQREAQAHQAIRVSLTGTNLPNELPWKVPQRTLRSCCAAARTPDTLSGSWPRCASNRWRSKLPMNLLMNSLPGGEMPGFTAQDVSLSPYGFARIDLSRVSNRRCCEL
jgi:hypothetical protein